MNALRFYKFTWQNQPLPCATFRCVVHKMLRPIRIINFSCCIYLCVWLYQFKYAKSDLYDYGGKFVKKQQCKKATRICKLNSFSDKTRRWKLGNNKKLENKEGVWKSDDLWIFKTKDNDLIYIENTSKGEFVKNNNVKRQQKYANLIFSQVKLKDGN